MFILHVPCQADSVLTAHTGAHICRPTAGQTHQCHAEGMNPHPTVLIGKAYVYTEYFCD